MKESVFAYVVNSVYSVEVSVITRTYIITNVIHLTHF